MDENRDEEADHIYFSDYEAFERYMDEYEKQQLLISDPNIYVLETFLALARHTFGIWANKM